MTEPYAFENLHVIENIDGDLNGYVIRYVPNEQWYESNGYSFTIWNFTGHLINFDLEYNETQNLQLAVGQFIMSSQTGKMNPGECDGGIRCVKACEVGNCHEDGSGCGNSGSILVIDPGCQGGSGQGDETPNDDPDEDIHGDVNNDDLDGNSNDDPVGGGNPDPSNPSDPTPVVPNTPTAQEQVITCLGLDNIETANQPLRDWINNSNNNLTVKAINSYLNQNSCSPEAQEFAELAAEAFMEGGEVDFPNKVILDPTFDGKINCIYDKLKESNNSYFKNILEELFESNKESHIYLKVIDIEDSDGNQLSAYTTPANLSNGSRAYQIEVDPDFIENSSLLLVAQTLIHEMIHAEIFERLVQLNVISITNDFNIEFISDEFNMYNDIENLNDYSIPIYTETFAQNPQWAHELFNVGFYREHLRANLEDFHYSIIGSDTSFINQVNSMGWDLYSDSGVYSSLSWNGLQNTQEFIDLDSTISNFIIEQILFTEINSNSNCNE